SGRKPSPERGLARRPDLRSKPKSWSLAISYHCAQLAGQEVVRWPRAADRHFTVFQLLGGGAVAILVFFYRLGIDQVGEVNQHARGSDLLAADFFFQRIEKLMHLHRERTGLGLALAFTGSLHPKLREIVAANGVGKLNVDHGLSKGTVAHPHLDGHFV